MSYKPTPTEQKDLAQEGFLNGTTYLEIYIDRRTQGLSHKDSVRAAFDGVEGLRSDTLSPEELKMIKHLIKKVPGQFF